MDTTTNQIKREIEQARERISETTSQIGERIRSTFDWRQQVAEHPWAAIGVAAGAGLAVGAAISRAFRGGAQAGPSYGEQYSYDRIASDVESRAPGMGDGGAWLRGAATAGAGWMPGRGEAGQPTTERETSGGGGRNETWRRRETGRGEGGMGPSGAMAGLLAGLGAALQPQLQEIGRTLAEQAKDLSAYLIGEGKETLKSRIDEWRSGGRRRAGGTAAGQTTQGAYGGGSQGGQGSQPWPTSPAAGGSTLSSESAGAWPSGGTTGGGV